MVVSDILLHKNVAKQRKRGVSERSLIISRTPYRVSFFGGGTDYPAWYQEHGGTVLATAINKYCYLTCRYLPPFFEHRYRIVYSLIENCQQVADIKHPVVREVLRYLNADRGMEIHHDGDLPARCGIGSSSSFTVGLLNALYALKGQVCSKQQLALESIHIEQQRIGETVGSQDQVLAAHGGFNRIVFSSGGEITVHPVSFSLERLSQLEKHLMLFYTGIKRTASDVAQTYAKNLGQRKQQMETLTDLVHEGVSVLTSEQDISVFGQLLHEAWQVKRSLSPTVSNSHVDEIYQQAIRAGALGGKLTGAGGGGFMILVVPPRRQQHVKQQLDSLIHVPFRFERQGSQIIFFDPEEDYSVQEQARVSQPLAAFRELRALSPRIAEEGS